MAPRDGQPLTADVRSHLESERTGATSPARRARPAHVALLTALCAVPTAAALVSGPHPDQWFTGALAFGVLVVGSELVLNEPWRAKRRSAMHPAEALAAAALVWSPGPWILMGVLLGTLVSRVLWRRHPLFTAWLVSRNALGVTVALVITTHVPDPVAGPALGMCGWWLLGALLSLVGEPYSQHGRSRADTWAMSGYHAALMAAVGILAGYLLPLSPMWGAALAIVIAPIVREYTNQRAEAAEREVSAALLLFLRGRDEQGVDAAAELALVAAEVAFASASTQATLELLKPLRRQTLSRDTLGDLVCAPSSHLTGRAQDLIARGTGAYQCAGPGRSAVFIAVIGAPDQPLAVLEVHWVAQHARRRAQQERLGRAAAEASCRWLTNAYIAENVPHNEGPAARTLREEVRPALVELKDASRRVAALVSDPQATDVSTEVVRELDRAGLAVAALMGVVSNTGEHLDPAALSAQIEPRDRGSIPLGPVPVRR